MRNKYSKEFEEEMRKLAPENELTRLLWVARQKYGYFITKTQLSQYLYKRHIIYKDYNINMKRNMGKDTPIGTEYVKSDGMTLIKVSKDKWEYKQRYLYEKKYGKLPKDKMVIFLDGNRNNLKLKNLMAVTTPEYNCIRNKGLISNNIDSMKTAILAARLYYLTKEK